MNRKVTKEALMLDMLRKGPTTSYDAVIGVPTTQAQRLVHRLRERGFDIFTEMCKSDGGAPYAKWYLVGEPKYVHEVESL